MGISPFSSVEFFIRVLLLGYRFFCQEILPYIYIHILYILYILYIYIYIYIYNIYDKHCCIRPFLNVIKVLLVSNPNCSFCFPPGCYQKNLAFDLK